MKNNNYILAASLIAIASLSARAVTVDGTLDGAYGGALSVQTINTGFGDSTVGDGTSAGGSELDAAYGMISGGYLYLFIAGNVESTGNHINLFISDGRSGQSTLSTSGGTMAAMNGSKFSPGFSATYALDVNDYSGTLYAEEYNLVANTGGYVGAIGLSGGIGNGTPGTATIGFNNSNAAGVNGSSGTAANALAAQAVNTGLELSIPLSYLGNPSSVNVLVDINGTGDGFLSNQTLSGQPVGTGNLGNGGVFDFSSAPGQYFTVAVVPEPSTLAICGLSGLATFFMIRRRR